MQILQKTKEKTIKEVTEVWGVITFELVEIQFYS